MNHPLKTIVFCACLALPLILATPAFAQAQIKVEIDDINIELLSTPQFSYAGDSKSLPKAKEWIEVEVEFEVEGRSETNYVDGLEFSYYVMMADKETMYVGKTTHANVKLDEKMFSAMYLSPATLEKLTGREATSAGVVEAVAVEVRYQGALIGGEATEAESSRWWQTKAQTGNKLLQKSETPFAILWTDRYAEIDKVR